MLYTPNQGYIEAARIVHTQAFRWTPTPENPLGMSEHDISEDRTLEDDDVLIPFNPSRKPSWMRNLKVSGLSSEGNIVSYLLEWELDESAMAEGRVIGDQLWIKTYEGQTYFVPVGSWLVWTEWEDNLPFINVYNDHWFGQNFRRAILDDQPLVEPEFRTDLELVQDIFEMLDFPAEYAAFTEEDRATLPEVFDGEHPTAMLRFDMPLADKGMAVYADFLFDAAGDLIGNQGGIH